MAVSFLRQELPRITRARRLMTGLCPLVPGPPTWRGAALATTRPLSSSSP